MGSPGMQGPGAGGQGLWREAVLTSGPSAGKGLDAKGTVHQSYEAGGNPEFQVSILGDRARSPVVIKEHSTIELWHQKHAGVPGSPPRSQVGGDHL